MVYAGRVRRFLPPHAAFAKLCSMIENPRIAIADRSQLAANIYQLLLVPFQPTLVVRRRFEELRPHFFRRERVHLGLFNSNTFGKKFDEILKHLTEDEPLRRVKKVFLCRASHAEDEWRERLGRLANSTVITRPFHPAELTQLLKRLLG